MAKKKGRAKFKLTRETVRRFPCPQCGADVDEQCYSHAGDRRVQNHTARVEVAQRTFGAKGRRSQGRI